MAKFKSTKQGSSGSTDFKETIEFEVLCMGKIDTNNNKHYCIELQKNDADEFILFCNYGRVGKTSMNEVRKYADGNPIDSEFIAKKEYDRIIKSKKKKGYEQVDTEKPSVGSDNIRNVTSTSATSSKGELSIINAFSDINTKEVLRNIWEENVHNISNMTTMSVSSSGISSPLGTLALPHIERAGQVLNDIRDSYSGSKEGLKSLNDMYYSMIPHPFGAKIPSSAMIDNDERLMEESDLIDQLKATVKVTDTKKKDDKIPELDFSLSVLTHDSAEFQRVNKKFIDTRADCHRDLFNWKITNVFEMDNLKSTENYNNIENRYKDTVYEVFHGSSSANIMSIIVNGLIIPRGASNGSMLGRGIYGATASSKALGYSNNRWSGRNKRSEIYLFLAEFAMGRINYPTGSLNECPSGYDSVFAKKDETKSWGGFLANDELVVYKLSQARLTHLIELKK